ncbi:MAG: sensor signal transduction histidine kinase, partial [Nitrospirae bacterium]|nr:sensor signal transduction histidine kinase [Nitrospirota bacterium]
MIKLPYFQYEDKVVLVSLLVGMGAWVLDSAIDAFVFSHAAFLDTLILEITPHELYFRLFILLVIFLFGVMTSRTLARRKFVEEELRKALARLEDEKAKTDAVVAAIPDGISILDRNYRVLYQNQVHRDLVGDQLGKVCYEKYAGRDTICPGCPVARSFEDGGNHVLVKSVPSQNGLSHIEISSSPLRNAKGEIIAGIEAVRNITERKQAEEELKKHRERLEDLVEERTAELKKANVRL